MSDLTFVTKISGPGKRGFEIRGYPLQNLIKEADFVSTLFLSITAQKPSPKQKKLLNAILVAAIDHGINPASGFVPRVVAASGNNVQTAMASTLLAIGPYHGGAVAGSMNFFLEIKKQGQSVEQNCEALIKKYKADKKRVPGFGHRKYKNQDPRAQLLLNIARANNLEIDFINLAEMVELNLEKEHGKKLPLNIDGALGALLLTLGFLPNAGNAIFALARVAGSIAHILEEQQSKKWVKRLSDKSVVYEY
jgi:citrate synthase